VTVLINGPFEFAMVRTAPNESSRDNQSKARAIVYNAGSRERETESIVFSDRWVKHPRLLILCAELLRRASA
jgi:hypothetical protein